MNYFWWSILVLILISGVFLACYKKDYIVIHIPFSKFKIELKRNK